MGRVAKMIEDSISGVYVHSIMVGDSIPDDERNGFLMNANDQVDWVCRNLSQNAALKNGFHAIGFSQGSQVIIYIIITS